MKLHIAPLGQRFGWELDGTLYDHRRWGSNEMEIQPFPVSGLTASNVSGYNEYMNAPFVAVPAGVSRSVDSDAYIPIGSKATIVLLEYEAWDRMTGEWTWVPATTLLQRDAVWIVNLGQYTSNSGDPEPPSDHSPRAIRVRKVLRQVRLQGGVWSSPVEIPRSSLFKRGVSGPIPPTWGDDAPTFEVQADAAIGGTLGAHPAIVLLDKLASAAMPRENLDNDKYQGRITVYPGKPGLRELLRRPWVGNESVLQLTIEAICLVYKVT
jgi:hypothetical protein